MTNQIYTVGHSSRDFDEMLAMLQNNEITRLADVRAFPSSRKFPQWNQSAIIDALPPDIVAGAEVADIMSPTTVKPAVLHKHAHVQDGHLTYPPQA
jgi:hypothetical protein